MGNWLIYGLGGLITLGLWDFTKKYIISKGVSKELYLVTFSFLVVVLFLGNWFFQGSGELSKKILFDGTLVGLSSFPGTLGIIIALKY